MVWYISECLHNDDIDNKANIEKTCFEATSKNELFFVKKSKGTALTVPGTQ